ncbi:MAG: vitamin K epoxide reductase family protein [Pirellulales bacterium]
MSQITEGPITVREDHPGPKHWWSLWVAISCGVVLTLLLIWQDRQFDPTTSSNVSINLPGCGAGQSCEQVLTSHYSEIFDLPLVYWNLAFYGLVAATLIISVLAWQLSVAPPLSLALPVIASIGLTAAVWSLSVLFGILREFCAYCVAINIVNITIFVLSFLYAREDWRIRQRRRWEVALPDLPNSPIHLHVVLAVLIMLTQIVAMSVFHDQPVVDNRLLQSSVVLGLKNLRADPIETIAVDVDDTNLSQSTATIWTTLGNRDATHKIIVYSCPTCPQCAAIHALLTTVTQRHPEVRVDIRFWPLWHACNDELDKALADGRHRYACVLVRCAIAVAAVDGNAFPEYLHWIYTNGAVLNETAAVSKARELVGSEAFDKALDSPAMWKRFSRDMELGNQLEMKTKTLPRLFIENGEVYGGVTVQNLEDLLVQRYGLQPIDASEHQAEPVWISPQYLTETAQLTSEMVDRGEYAAAVKNYRRLLKVKNDWPLVASRLAWLLATCPDESVRDGEAAVYFGKLAYQIFNDTSATNSSDDRLKAVILDALAAGYAENGQFEEAQDTAKAAVGSYQKALQMREATEMETRMEMYQRHQPYRQSAN